MSTRTRWTMNGALIGVLPGAIGFLLAWTVAGCPDSPGQPGMVCYDIQHFLFRIASIAAIVGFVVGGVLGWSIRRRHAS